MGKIAANSMEVLITIGLIYGVLKYWNWKLVGGYDVETKNRSYGIFVFGQIATMFAIIIEGLDPQNSAYLENLSMFSDGAYDYWSVLGVQLFGFILLFMTSNIIGHLLFRIGFDKNNSLYETIREDNTTPVLVATVVIFVIGFVSSAYVLRPFIFDWISRNAALIPMN